MTGTQPAKSCHYCGSAAGTRDHIVPRSRVDWKRRNQPRQMAASNIVPSCGNCNNFKNDRRSNCDCDKCALAWETYGPSGWQGWIRIDPTGWKKLIEKPELGKIKWVADSGR